jgi:RNA polymerase sigma-70 factor (ECF subfamily)
MLSFPAMPQLTPLANQLAGSAPPGEPASVAVELAAHLEERLAAARAKWPAIELDDAVLLRRLWPERAQSPRTVAALVELHLEDLFLACACAEGDREAISVLESTVLARIPAWVASFAGVSAADVQQEMRQKLLLGPSAHLRDYAGRGALARWVRIGAHRCAIDMQRAVKPSGEGDEVEQLLASPDPEIDFVKLHDRETLRQVLRDAVRTLPAPARVLLRLHYLEGLSLERLAALERVHRATVARHLADARAEAMEAVRKLLRERLKLTDAEGMSFLRLLESRLDLSLRSAFSASQLQ